MTLEEKAKDYSNSHVNLFMDSAEDDGIIRSDLIDAFISGAKYEQEHRPITLPEYQIRAMATCLPTCNNFSYMMINIVGEVGELASKVAKAIRKDEATIVADNLRQPSTRHIDDDLNEAMQLEAGDVLWQLAGLCSVMGWDLEKIAKMNLEKLASRQKRGVIDGNGDNR